MKAIITALPPSSLLAGPIAEAVEPMGEHRVAVHAASLGPAALPQGRIERLGWARASSAGSPTSRRPGAEFRFDF